MYSPYTVEVAVGIWRTVVVDDNVYSLHINTTTENIRRNENTLLEGFESRVSGDAIRRLRTR